MNQHTATRHTGEVCFFILAYAVNKETTSRRNNMCGILGILGAERPNELEQMLETTKHRGEDVTQYASFGDFGSIGINRLSIVDLERGNQPIYNEDRSICVVCNGEIYNTLAIRDDLSKDHQYNSRSDAEVLVHCYEEYGDDMVKFLDGMFAFILLDLKNKRFIAARDPLGIKPLSYRQENDVIYFASEIKGLVDYGDTGIRNLPPGHMWSSDNGIQRYYDPSLHTSVPSYNMCRALMQNAIEKRTLGDVEIGTFLSGGIDSSIITAMASKIRPGMKAFTIGFPDSPDVQMAKKVAERLDIEHIVEPLDLDMMYEVLPQAIYHIETYNPSMVTGAVVTLLVSKLARKHGVKVVLCGEGADELFGGYSALRDLKNLELRSKLYDLMQNLHNTELRRLDRMSMAVSLEARVPFLDRDFVEYAFNLPSSEKIREIDGKKIEKYHLRKAFEDLLPHELIWREKMPFDKGSGSRSFIPQIEAKISDEEFAEKCKKYSHANIQSKEMLYYYEIWRKHFGGMVEKERTFKMFGDYPVLMDTIASRGIEEKE